MSSSTWVKYRDADIYEDWILQYNPCTDEIKWRNTLRQVRELPFSTVEEIQAFVRKSITCGEE